MSAARRPHIVYVFTDQQSASAMSAAGGQHLHTPAMDAIAARGVRFGCAYTSFPLCVPARTSMFTGRMPHEAGVLDNYPRGNTGVPFPMLGRLMADAGYACHYVGKWHITPVAEGDTRSHGFERVVFGGGYGGLDSAKTDAALAFIRRQHDEPFFLVVSYNNPHDCCELSRGDALRMGALPPPPGAGELPPLPANFAVPEGEPDCIRELQRRYPRYLVAADWDERRAREYLWGYYRLTEMVDAEVGRLLEGLEDAGLADDTIVVFSSDHGDGGAAHHWNQKWVLYDESVRVPLIFAGAGIGAQGRTERTPVSATLDLMPTILDLAGVAVPDGCRGRSLRPVLDGDESARPREFVAAETALGNLDGGAAEEMVRGRMIRTERFKYSAFEAGSPREQLVDVQTDPGEMVNLAANPTHREVLARHRELLREWCARTGDGFTLPGGRG
jgi:arylsulfatase A-like enzyme